MAATVRATAVAVTDTATATIAVPLPTGWQANDVCYIGLTCTVAGGTITTPAGWTAVVAQFASAGSASAITACFRRVLQAGDTSPVTVTTTSARRTAISVAVQGADTTTPEDATPTSDTNSGVSYPSVRCPSITTVTAGALLLCFAATRNGTISNVMSWAPPSGMNEEVEQDNASAASSTCGIELSSLTLGAAGATGTQTATVTFGSGTNSAPTGMTIAVRPAAGAAVGLPDLAMARYGG